MKLVEKPKTHRVFVADNSIDSFVADHVSYSFHFRCHNSNCCCSIELEIGLSFYSAIQLVSPAWSPSHRCKADGRLFSSGGCFVSSAREPICFPRRNSFRRIFLNPSRRTFLVPIVFRVSVNEVEASSWRCKSVAVDAEGAVSSNPYCCLSNEESDQSFSYSIVCLTHCDCFVVSVPTVDCVTMEYNQVVWSLVECIYHYPEVDQRSGRSASRWSKRKDYSSSQRSKWNRLISSLLLVLETNVAVDVLALFDSYLCRSTRTRKEAFSLFDQLNILHCRSPDFRFEYLWFVRCKEWHRCAVDSNRNSIDWLSRPMNRIYWCRRVLLQINEHRQTQKDRSTTIYRGGRELRTRTREMDSVLTIVDSIRWPSDDDRIF